MSSQVIKILTGGGTVELEDKHPALEELQEAVGGLIMVVNIACGIMVVDEEGVLKEKSHNMVASVLANQRIVGDVVVMPSDYL